MSTETMDTGTEAGEDAADERQYVTFSLGGETFAVPMAPVQEIIRVPQVAQLPLAPPALEGLANLRGRVLPIVNLRRLLACPPRDNDDQSRALVVRIGQPLGFIVDRVSSVIGVEPGEIEPADGIQSIVQSRFLSGVIRREAAGGGHDLMLVVDFERLVADHFSRAAAEDAKASGPALGDEADVDEAERAVDELRLVSFSVAQQEYALDIAEVQEIVQLPEHVNALPNAPAHVAGLVSLRQRLLPLVSLRALFGAPPVPYTEQQRIVVAALPGDLRVGLVTDSVKEVLSVPRTSAEPMPAALAAEQDLKEFTSICRLDEGRRLVSIIATNRLLRSPALGAALDAARQATAGTSTTADTTEEAAMAQDEALAEDDDAHVIFRLGAEEFGVPIMSVQEIVRVPEALTRVPKTPAFVEGVINLRGSVLPVIDQRRRLGLPSIERNEGQRIMVYMVGGARTGFIVDSVAEVLRIPARQIAPAPRLSDEQNRLIHRVANLPQSRRLVMLIDPAQLLQGLELDQVRELSAAPAPAAPGQPAQRWAQAA